MRNSTFASRVFREFAEARRRVFSDWRILIIARHVATAENARLPGMKKALELREELLSNGDIESVSGINNVYVTNVPYSNLLEYSEEQIIQEANPYAVFGYLTALTYHGLTDLIGKAIYPILPKNFDPDARLPLGTTPEDWSDDIPLPPLKQPKKVLNSDVVWTQPAVDPGFGVTVGYSHGVPIYVTDIERTLYDAIKAPEKCGGIVKVLAAWKRAEDLDIEKIIDYTNRAGVQAQRQRIGYILDKLGHRHERLNDWRRGVKRGGSLKLVSDEPYASIYSDVWNISLNAPEEAISILD